MLILLLQFQYRSENYPLSQVEIESGLLQLQLLLMELFMLVVKMEKYFQ